MVPAYPTWTHNSKLDYSKEEMRNSQSVASGKASKKRLKASSNTLMRVPVHTMFVSYLRGATGQLWDGMEKGLSTMAVLWFNLGLVQLAPNSSPLDQKEHSPPKIKHNMFSAWTNPCFALWIVTQILRNAMLGRQEDARHFVYRGLAAAGAEKEPF